MRLTRQTNYAIRMLMYCGARDGQLSRVADIARTYNVSELFLFKILQPLVEKGLAETVRGRNGGVRLGKPGNQITLLDVVRTTEENFALAECFNDETGDCPLTNNCALHGALGRALSAFFTVLDEYTITDLIEARPDIHALLGIDPPKLRAASA